MAVTAKILRYIIDAGGGFPEAIHVAEAMERGDDAWRVFSLEMDMEKDGRARADIGAAIIRCADQIKEDWVTERSYRSSAPDPYRERRGISASAWSRLREMVFERDGYECRYCGCTDELAVDHIIPLSRGGTNDPENLTPACKPCNSSKRDKLVEEWLRD